MVGTGIKKFARENNLNIKNGIAYGNYKGYMLTLNEGSGWKSASITVRLDSLEMQNSVSAFVSNQETTKKYNVRSFTVNEHGVFVHFNDTIGTMKKLIAYVNEITSLLLNIGAQGMLVCNHCGQPFTYDDAITVSINNTAYRMHASCADEIYNEAQQINTQKQNTGSVATGVIGAFLGGIIGAIPWAIAYYFGWFVAWLGFIIGIAAKKGYEILKGTESRIKAVAVIAATVFSVVLVEIITLLVIINMSFAADPELVAIGYNFTDVVMTLIYAVMYDSSIAISILVDIGLGLVFAALGIYSTAKDIFTLNSPKNGTPIRLD